MMWPTWARAMFCVGWLATVGVAAAVAGRPGYPGWAIAALCLLPALPPIAGNLARVLRWLRVPPKIGAYILMIVASGVPTWWGVAVGRALGGSLILTIIIAVLSFLAALVTVEIGYALHTQRTIPPLPIAPLSCRRLPPPKSRRRRVALPSQPSGHARSGAD